MLLLYESDLGAIFIIMKQVRLCLGMLQDLLGLVDLLNRLHLGRYLLNLLYKVWSWRRLIRFLLSLLDLMLDDSVGQLRESFLWRLFADLVQLLFGLLRNLSAMLQLGRANINKGHFTLRVGSGVVCGSIELVEDLNLFVHRRSWELLTRCC